MASNIVMQNKLNTSDFVVEQDGIVSLVPKAAPDNELINKILGYYDTDINIDKLRRATIYINSIVSSYGVNSYAFTTARDMILDLKDEDRFAFSLKYIVDWMELTNKLERIISDLRFEYASHYFMQKLGIYENQGTIVAPTEGTTYRINGKVNNSDEKPFINRWPDNDPYQHISARVIEQPGVDADLWENKITFNFSNNDVVKIGIRDVDGGLGAEYYYGYKSISVALCMNSIYYDISLSDGDKRGRIMDKAIKEKYKPSNEKTMVVFEINEAELDIMMSDFNIHDYHIGDIDLKIFAHYEDVYVSMTYVPDGRELGVFYTGLSLAGRKEDDKDMFIVAGWISDSNNHGSSYGSMEYITD